MQVNPVLSAVFHRDYAGAGPNARAVARRLWLRNRHMEAIAALSLSEAEAGERLQRAKARVEAWKKEHAA